MHFCGVLLYLLLNTFSYVISSSHNPISSPHFLISFPHLFSSFVRHLILSQLLIISLHSPLFSKRGRVVGRIVGQVVGRVVGRCNDVHLPLNPAHLPILPISQILTNHLRAMIVNSSIHSTGQDDTEKSTTTSIV